MEWTRYEKNTEHWTGFDENTIADKSILLMEQMNEMAKDIYCILDAIHIPYSAFLYSVFGSVVVVGIKT